MNIIKNTKNLKNMYLTILKSENIKTAAQSVTSLKS